MIRSAARSVRHSLARSRAHLRVRDLVFVAGRRNLWVVREDLARRYVSGDGIEIGALNAPLRVPPAAHVRYVDRMSRVDLIRTDESSLRVRGVDSSKVRSVDVVDDAERLSRFASDSLDFVIANHVLEHIEDPVLSLENMLRVLRPGGILLLVLPDPRHTFDARRPRTTIDHVLRDHLDGPEVSRWQHYEEWARLIEGLPEELVAARAGEFARDDAHHHFHVWELEDFLALLRALELPYDLLHAQSYLEEFAVVLRRVYRANHT
jgi:SAM-dependent methyltransferase